MRAAALLLALAATSCCFRSQLEVCYTKAEMAMSERVWAECDGHLSNCTQAEQDAILRELGERFDRCAYD